LEHLAGDAVAGRAAQARLHPVRRAVRAQPRHRRRQTLGVAAQLEFVKAKFENQDISHFQVQGLNN
jgi:hypothetical protein